ncbi:thioesterase II family protein [Actinomyces sp. Marseille-P3109]|uniref:thioesterase II family protein n=1 Tax=Actinomyces sp. Marseille-P3109 TaxID=2083009 RepID=UPI000D55BC4E|nr:alpha/beta fold hydrolase [Actinomyces sp. Marseille-P3109]
MAQRHPNTWFVRRGTAKGTRPLYIFPHAGAGAASVHSLVTALASSFDAYAVRLPGRESRVREPFFLDLNLLSAELAREIAGHAQGDPPVLYGHCGGATIAWMTTRRLQEGHSVNAELAVSSHPAPGTSPRNPSWILPREAFLAQVRTDGYLPEGLVEHDEIMAIYEPILRADYELIEKFELKMNAEASSFPTIQGGALGLYGSADTTVTRKQIEAWARLCTEDVEVIELIAGHDLPRAVPHAIADALVHRFDPGSAI